MPEYDVIEFARTQLTLPDKLDPADEMSWQHYLYSKLGKKEPLPEETAVEKANSNEKNKEKIIEETVERIVAMAKVLFGLHMVCVYYSKSNLFYYLFLSIIYTLLRVFQSFLITTKNISVKNIPLMSLK